jgi:predicted ATPase/DNA-binding SARP family transcriptional activator/uncharacterized protein HemY
MVPRLILQFLGLPQVLLENRPISTDRRKAIALLAYLAVNDIGRPRQRYSRGSLSALLWPDYEQAKAFSNLRVILWELRQVLGEDWLIADRETVHLNDTAEIDLDVARFLDLLSQARQQNDASLRIPLLSDAVKLYRDHFLTGFSLKDAPNFNEWAFAESEDLRRKLAEALTTLSEDHSALGQVDQAIPYARRLIALDPLNESSHRQLMEVYWQAGQHSAALKQYQACEQILRKELNLDPQPETRALYKKILKGEVTSVHIEKQVKPSAPKHNLPTGTVTFLFTDIEGSTQLWEQAPEAMKAAHARHESIIREVVAAHGGYTYKMIGDAFQIAFATAPEALAAALDGQRALYAEPWAETVPIRVRMALHTGVTEERGDDYVGPVLNRVARLLGAGHGGQVLLTQSTYDLVHDTLPSDVSLRDLGERRLKDLVRPEHIYQLIAPGLPADYPPLKTPGTFPHNLPAQLTSFIGREQELNEIINLIAKNRLVTLTGAGGIGKSRLSIQVAFALVNNFPNGTWLVELAPLSDPALVLQAIVTTLGLIEQANRPLQTILTDFLQEKKSLLILDNCEHLIQACAQLAETLLRACPDLHILATSREALGVAGEAVYLVPSLTTPDPLKSTLDSLSEYEAVQLFLERAQSAMRDFSLTKENAQAIAQVCHHLDGIPLALELAAARVRGLSVEQIASRLDDRFHLLMSRTRTVLPRHQTLQAMIDWSHDLLTESERVLLRRLSMFASGWTLEAAEAVCASDELKSNQILDLLLHLVDKSLVVAETQEAESRYHMLETIRQYAREKLWAAGEGDLMCQRHLAYFVDLAERAEPNLRAFEMVMWLDRLESELDNIRVALEYALESNIEAQLRLASALWWFWHIRDHKGEGTEWLERALSIEAMERTDRPLTLSRAIIRGKALYVAGFLRVMMWETGIGATLSEESLTLFRDLGPAGKRGMAYALWNLSVVAAQQSDLRRRKALMEESLALFQEVGDKFGIAQCLPSVASNAMNLDGDFERARALTEEGLDLYKEIGDKDGIANTLQSLGYLAFQQGDYQQATTWFESSLALFQEVRNKYGLGGTLYGLAQAAKAQGRYGKATTVLEEALALEQNSGRTNLIAYTLYSLGEVAAAQGNYEQAAERYEEGLAASRKTRNPGAIASGLYGLGKIAWAQGDYVQAIKKFEAALAISREAGNKFETSSALQGLGKVAQSQRDYATARSYYTEAIVLRGEISDRFSAAFNLEAIATLATVQKQLEQAARLFGVAETLLPAIRFEMFAVERDEHDWAVATTRAELGEEAFMAAWEEGKKMTLAEAVAYALGDDG